MLLPLPANPTIPTRIRLFFLVREGSRLGSAVGPTLWLSARCARMLDDLRAWRSAASSSWLRGRRVAHRAPRAKRARAPVPESNPIKRIDDLLGDVGDRLGRWPLPIRNLWARRANSLWVSAGLRFEVVGGEHLDQPPVKEDPGRERGRVELSGRGATRSSAGPAGTRGSPGPPPESERRTRR